MGPLRSFSSPPKMGPGTFRVYGPTGLFPHMNRFSYIRIRGRENGN